MHGSNRHFRTLTARPAFHLSETMKTPIAHAEGTRINALPPCPLGVRFGSSGKLHGVYCLREAVELWEKYRDGHNLGASESPAVTVVQIQSGETIARISYNGRLWRLDGSEIDLRKPPFFLGVIVKLSKPEHPEEEGYRYALLDDPRTVPVGTPYRFQFLNSSLPAGEPHFPIAPIERMTLEHVEPCES